MRTSHRNLKAWQVVVSTGLGALVSTWGMPGNNLRCVGGYLYGVTIRRVAYRKNMWYYRYVSGRAKVHCFKCEHTKTYKPRL